MIYCLVAILVFGHILSPIPFQIFGMRYSVFGLYLAEVIVMILCAGRPPSMWLFHNNGFNDRSFSEESKKAPKEAGRCLDLEGILDAGS